MSPGGDHRSAGPSEALPTATLTLVTLAATVGFIRVFDTADFLVPLGFVVVAGHLLASATRRLPTGWSTIGMLAAGALVTIDATHFSSATLGVPTPSTFAVIADDIDAAIETLRTGSAPVAPEAGLLFAVAVGLWIVAWSTDRLTFSYAAPIEALIPSATVFVVVTSLAGPDHRWSSAAVYGAAAAVHVLVVRPVDAREHRTAATQKGRWGPIARGGAMAGVALVVGLGAAATVPALDTKGLVGLHDQHTITVVSPLVDIRSRLVDQTDHELFTVEARHGEYWRLMALDDFDGETWSPPDSRVPEAGTMLPSGDLRPDYDQFQASFDLTGLGGQFAPAPYRPTGLYALTDTDDPDGDPRLLWDQNYSTLIASSTTRDVTGLSYVITAQVPDVDAAQVRAATGGIPSDIRGRFTRLPADFPTTLRDRARQIVAGASTPYDKALALQHYFSPENGFSYSTDLQQVPAGENTNAMISFLDVRRGFCEQFAGTYAALARAVGLPTRIAVGFTWGRRERAVDGSSTFVVTGRNAHAWPEVYFAGLGWLPFEPTPGRGNPAATDYTGVEARQDDAVPDGPEVTAPATTASAEVPTIPPTTDPSSITSTPAAVPPTGAATSPPTSRSSGLPLGAVVVLVVVALTVVAGPGSRTLGHRRRRRAADTPARVVRLAWAEALQAWRPHDLVRRASDTDRDLGERLQGRLEQLLGPDAPDLEVQRLAGLATAAAWNRAGVTAGEAREAVAIASRVARVAADHRTRLARVLGWFDPRGPSMPPTGSCRSY